MAEIGNETRLTKCQHLTAAVKLQNRDDYTAYYKSMHTTQALLNYLQWIKNSKFEGG